MTDHPTVRLSDLVLDACNFKDTTFERYVSQWMDRMMQSIPIGLLDTESDIAHERWQLQPDACHRVMSVTWAVWNCPECGESYTPAKPASCCEGVELDPDEQQSFVLYNDSTSEAVTLQDYVRYADLNEDRSDVPFEDDEVLGWDDECDANKAAEQADQRYYDEHGRENMCGFPWANSYAYIPDGYITDGSLKAAGFRVAVYVGGKGDARDDQEFRLAGIDGGGYSFQGSHWARLVAHHHESHGQPVETDQGPAYITTDERSPLEILADVGSIKDGAPS